MSTRTLQQKAEVCAAVKAYVNNNSKPNLESQLDFWTKIRAALRDPPHNIFLTTNQCRGLYDSSYKHRTPQDSLPDIRKYISNGVRRKKRAEERAQLAESEEKGDEEEATSGEVKEDGADLEMENENVDGSEGPRAVQMTLAMRPK